MPEPDINDVVGYLADEIRRLTIELAVTKAQLMAAQREDDDA